MALSMPVCQSQILTAPTALTTSGLTHFKGAKCPSHVWTQLWSRYSHWTSLLKAVRNLAASHSMQRSGEAFGLEQAARNGHNDSLVDRLVEENRCGQVETWSKSRRILNLMGLEDYYNKISKVSWGIPYYFTRKPGRSQGSFHTKVFLQIWHHKLKGFRDFKGLRRSPRSLGWSKAFLKHIIVIIWLCRHVDM